MVRVFCVEMTGVFRPSAAAAAGAAASVPFYINRAFAQDQMLRIYAWAGYFTDEMLADFTAKTGIKATFTPYGTNDELMNSSFFK